MQITSLLPSRSLQHISNSIIRRLPLKILPPKRRIAVPRERFRNPGYRIPKIPNCHSNALLFIHTRPRRIRIHLRLDHLARPIRWQRLPHVQLGQRCLQSQTRVQRLRVSDLGVRWRPADCEVRLEADAVDGDVACEKVFGHGLDGAGFVIYALDAVVVVVELRSGRSVFARPDEGLLDVGGAEGVEPDVFTVGPVVVEGFVYYKASLILCVGRRQEAKWRDQTYRRPRRSSRPSSTLPRS